MRVIHNRSWWKTSLGILHHFAYSAFRAEMFLPVPGQLDFNSIQTWMNASVAWHAVCYKDEGEFDNDSWRNGSLTLSATSSSVSRQTVQLFQTTGPTVDISLSTSREKKWTLYNIQYHHGSFFKSYWLVIGLYWSDRLIRISNKWNGLLKIKSGWAA